MLGLFGSLDIMQKESEKLGKLKCIGDIAKRLNHMKDNGVVPTYVLLADVLEAATKEAMET